MSAQVALTESLRRDARRLGAELVVIIVGVLIALAADAAMETRDDLRKEQVFLEDILTEFRENESRLLTDIEGTQRAAHSASLWRDARTGSPQISADSVAALYAASFVVAQRFDAISGALRSLIDGGDLNLVRNLELRRALAGWSDRTREHELTFTSILNSRSALHSTLINSSVELPLAALYVNDSLLNAMASQQAALLGPLRGVIELLETELDR